MENTVFNIDNFWDYENFQIHLGNFINPIEMTRPILQLVSGSWENGDIIVKTAYLTIDKIIIECPLRVFYCEFSQVDLTHNGYSYDMKCNISIFNKDFSEKKEINFIKHKIRCDDFCHLLNNFLKYCNSYINKEYNIKEFEFVPHTKSCDLSDVLKVIRQLKLKFFKKGISRPGKDDYESYYAEISNLPKDTFLTELLVNTFKRKEKFIVQDYSFVEYKDEIIKIFLYTETIGGMASPRMQEIEMADEEQRIKDTLTIYMIKNFNEEKEYWTRYTRNSIKNSNSYE